MIRRRATLLGPPNQPLVRLEFNRFERVSAKDHSTLLDWVKALPGRRWNPDASAWDVTAFTSLDPYEELTDAGFEVVDEDGTDAETLRVTMRDYRSTMLAKISKDRSVTLVRPRFMPYDDVTEILGAAAEWDKARGRFEVPTTDVIDPDGNWPFEIEFIDVDASTVGKQMHRAQAAPVMPKIDPDDVVIPPWFGLDLYPYQRESAIAGVAEGKTLVAHPPGLGKTRTALAVAAIVGAQRTIVVTPPVMLTGWQRESDAAGIAHAYSPDGEVTEHGEIVLWQAGKTNLPPVPERGVVVVSDSLLVSRAHLHQALVDWKADALIVDEAHRQKTWSSARSKAVRSLAGSVRGPRMALTGTPLFANPVELAGVMGITGHLTSVFGGYGKYVIRYAQKNRFKAWVARPKMLPELRKRLTDEVWVRRERHEVLDLPAMTRNTLYTDVDLRGFNQAHRDVIAAIDEWLDEVRPVLRKATDKKVEEFIHDYAANSLHLVTMLRRAAGLAKIEAAGEIVREWVEYAPVDAKTGEWPSPLILWTHHKDVTRAMYDAAIEATGDEDAVAVIDGSTKQDERTEIVDDFQAGKIAVLVASITAAGVGITLTRSTDAIYVETDWTPALIQQADFRINRIGQTRPTRVTTLVAPGTLDEYIHRALGKKGQILSAVLGGDQDVSADIDEDISTPIEIVKDMVRDRLNGKAVSHVRTRRARATAKAAS